MEWLPRAPDGTERLPEGAERPPDERDERGILCLLYTSDAADE